MASKHAGAPAKANLDGMRELRLFGWARGALAGAEEVTLRCGGERIAAPVWRVLRSDVSHALGEGDVHLGFEIDLPPTLWRRRDADGVALLQVEVEGNLLPTSLALSAQDVGALLDVAAATTDPDRRRTLIGRALMHFAAVGSIAGLSAAQRRVLAEVAGAQADPLAHLPALAPPFSAQIESRGTLVLAGWTLGAEPGRERFELRCGDVPIQAPIQRTQRRDVAIATGSTHLMAGFEVEIPGAVWTNALGAQSVCVHMLIDGFAIGSPIVLDRSRLGGYLRTALTMTDDTARRRHGLLALEHIADAGCIDLLSGDDREAAQRLAREEGLGELATEPIAPAPWTPIEPRPIGRWGRRLEQRIIANAALGLLRALRRAADRWPALRSRADAFERVLLQSTGLFHKAIYVQQLAPDAAPPGSALRHYLAHGAAEGLVPNALFDPRRYVAQLPGRRPPDIAPLLHYALWGRFNGLSPSPWFDPRFYLDANPDVRREGIDPLRHFLSWGWRDGRAPYAGFDVTQASGQRVEIRMARRALPAGASLLGYLLSGLPTSRSLPRHQRLPWWPVASLDDIDYRAPAHWAALRPRPPAAGAVVDVLVPVYAGIQETLSCLLSVLQARNDAAFELVVIDDMSPEPALSAWLREFAARGLLTLHANAANLGFVRTVNRGLALHPDRDVVILNSDTVVYDGWLDRLLAHGRAAGAHVASVTPMSNNATLCSYPLASAENWEPLEIDHPELDRLAAQVNAGASTSAPTGVGFCMLMTRRALDVVGLLDEQHFGRGYGEENDWCQRSERAGYANLLAADVYVRHRGSVSFGGEADERMQSVLDTLESLHPGYLARISAFAADDGLAAARRRLDAARLVRADPRPRVLSVSHARGGGTERAEAEQTRRWQADGHDVVTLRPAARAGCIAIVGSPALHLPNLLEIPLTDDVALAELFTSLKVVAVQVHHLVDFPAGFKALFQAALARVRIAPDVMVHDYYAVCPRINLVDRSGVWCGELGVSQCQRCIADGDLPEPVDSITSWRAANLAMLEAARAIAVPHADVAQRLAHYFPHLSTTVVPHEDRIAVRPATPPLTRFGADTPARVLAIGALSAIKGFAVIRDLATWAGEHRAPLRLELLGFSMDDAALGAAGVSVHGRYDDRGLAARIDALAPDLILVPSVWPETYCYVLSAAFASGRRVAVFDLGAQGERLRAHGGLLLPLALASRPAELAGTILAFLREVPT